MKLNENIIKICNTYFLSIDELVYMYTLFINENWDVNIIPASIKKLTNLNLISGDKLTPAGEDLVIAALTEEGENKITPDKDRFDEIWEIYPRHDGFMNFDKTRVLRFNKAQTKQDYQEALQTYTHEQLLNALKAEIQFRSNPSSENLFKYMPASHNWFRRKCYETFMGAELEHKTDNEYGKEIS